MLMHFIVLPTLFSTIDNNGWKDITHNHFAYSFLASGVQLLKNVIQVILKKLTVYLFLMQF